MFFQDFVIDLVSKATVLLLAISLVDWGLQWRASAGVRHRIWAATFVALLMLPLLSATVPRWRIAILPAQWGQTEASIAQVDSVIPAIDSTQSTQSAESSWNELQVESQLSEFENRLLNENDQFVTRSSEELLITKTSKKSVAADSVSPELSLSIFANWQIALATLFVVGFCVAIAPLLRGLVRNACLERSSRVVEEQESQQFMRELCQRLSIERKVKLLETDQSIVPMTWGVFKPVVILPSQWRQWLTESRRLVLLHELAHVKRLDVVYQCVARVACAIFWFHPLAWYALRRLRIERELACDDCVLMAGERPSSYAKQLLDIAREYQSLALPPAVAMAQRSGLEQRVRALLDKARSHLPISPRAAQVLLLGALVTVTLLAAVHVEAMAKRTVDSQPAQLASPDLLSIVGRVVGPDGQPVQGAQVIALREYEANTSWKKSYEELSKTTSGTDGSYALQVPRVSERFTDGTYFEVQSTHVLASKPGFGPDQRLVSETEKATDLNLAKAEKVIEGQVVDLEGQPLAGIQVHVTEIKVARGPLDEWLLKAVKNPATLDEMAMSAMRNTERPKSFGFPDDHSITAMESLSYPMVETDSHGKFRVSGIGDDREVILRLDGNTISSTLLTAVTREMPAVNMPEIGKPTYRVGKTFGTKFVVSGEPAQLIRGRIIDRETQVPIAGAIVRLASYADRYWALDNFLTTRTNELGEYSLPGVPKAPENSRGVRIEVIPPLDMPYFAFDELLPKVAGLEPIEFDVQLTPGIWIEGQATDAKTGQPIRGSAAYYPGIDNEKAKDHEAFDRGKHTVGYGDGRFTDEQGRFRIPALPGAGAVRFVAEEADKYELQGPGWVDGQSPDHSWKLYHIMMPGNAMVRVDLPTEPKTAKVELAVTPSPTKRFRVVDELGQPVVGYEFGGQYPTDRPTVTGRGPRYWGKTQLASEVEIAQGAGNEKDRPLMFFHKGRELAAVIDAATWQQDQSEIMTVTLLPCAKLTGRLVFPEGTNSTGRLIAGYGAIEELDRQSAESLPRKNLKYRFEMRKASSESDGTFSLILPASKKTSIYHYGDSVDTTILENATLEPGQVLDLGEIGKGKQRAAAARDSSSNDLNDRKSGSAKNYLVQQTAKPQNSGLPSDATAEDSTKNTTSLNFEGQVVDSQGAAVAGAKIFFVVYQPQSLPTSNLQPVATTNSKGQFKFQIKPDELKRAAGDEWHYTQVYATHPNLGVAEKSAFTFETTGAMLRGASTAILHWFEDLSTDKRLTMVADDRPIKGRVVSVEGAPIAGAQVRVHELWLNDSGSLDAWEQAAMHPKADYYSLRKQVSSRIGGYEIPSTIQGYSLPSLIPDVRTDRDGRFEIKGLGRERIVELVISGPTIETTLVKARTRRGGVVTVPNQLSRGMSGWMETYNPCDLTHVATPSVPVIGRVIDKETGRPIANMTVSVGYSATFSGSGKNYIRAVTDSDGRYEIHGLSLSGEDDLHFIPPIGSNYLPQTFQPNLKGRRDPLALDVGFTPAPTVTGKVINERTGEPVLGAIEYFALQTNTELPNYGRFKYCSGHETRTKPDGSFTITAVPGAGFISFRALDHSKYKRAAKSPGIGSSIQDDMPGLYMTVPHAVMAWEVNALKEVDVKRTEPNDVQIVVRSGENVYGQVKTADGWPATDIIYSGLFEQGGWSPVKGESFVVEGYYEDEARDVYFYHPATSTAAHVRLQGKVPKPLVVKLQPAATIRGRLLDKGGLPIVGAPIKGSNIIDNNLGRPELAIDTDDDGRFEIPGIVPGQSYSAYTVIEKRGVPPVFKDMVVDKAEVKDLGDITLEQ